jgi:hypothetical protein
MIGVEVGRLLEKNTNAASSLCDEATHTRASVDAKKLAQFERA